jgi:hypothetical protein
MDDQRFDAAIAKMVEDSMELARKMGELLAGHPRAAQGAALLDCLGQWIAGHYQGGEEIMEQLLANHVAMVRIALPMQIERIKDNQRGRPLDG